MLAKLPNAHRRAPHTTPKYLISRLDTLPDWRTAQLSTSVA